MQWARLINPWALIAQLEAQNAALEQKCEELWSRAEDAEDRAFRRASEHYYHRSRMVEEQLKATQQQLVNIASLTPPIAAIDLAALADTGEVSRD